MPNWMEKIKNTLSAKADLKSLFIELQPDNRVSTVMVVSYVPTDKDSFPVFMDLTARIAMDKEVIPDNLLLRFEGIPAKEIPFNSELLAKDNAEALRFIVSHGGITEDNSVSLRKVAFLKACQREMTTDNLRELDHSQGYTCFVSHEEAMEKARAGKPSKLFFTIAETSQGAKVFNDGLPGRRDFRNYLQSLADHFFSNSLQDVDSLRLYRIETTSKKMLELSGDTRQLIPVTHDGLEILKGYKPSVVFDMHPVGENLDRFVTTNSLELSSRNWNVMMLQDIAQRGYAHLSTDESFAYKKEFAPVDKGLREIARQRDLEREYPFEKKMEELQTAARSMARTLLNIEGVRKEHRPIPPAVIIPDIPNPPQKETTQASISVPRPDPEKKVASKTKGQKETVKSKTASRKKQIKPKL